MANRLATAKVHPRWRFRSQRPDALTLDWLMDPGSLTARLVAFSKGDFRVRVRRVVWARPTLTETRALGLRIGERALVREVVLEGLGEAWVVARSVVPPGTLTGRNRQIRHLGSKPLGAFLFRDPGLKREAVEIVRLAVTAGDIKGVGANSMIWGRCSKFILRGKPLLVAEYFLPALLQRAAVARTAHAATHSKNESPR